MIDPAFNLLNLTTKFFIQQIILSCQIDWNYAEILNTDFSNLILETPRDDDEIIYKDCLLYTSDAADE